MRFYILLLLVAGLVGCGSEVQLKRHSRERFGKSVSKWPAPRWRRDGVSASRRRTCSRVPDRQGREFQRRADFRRVHVLRRQSDCSKRRQLLSKISPAYLQADLSRTVSVDGKSTARDFPGLAASGCASGPARQWRGVRPSVLAESTRHEPKARAGDACWTLLALWARDRQGCCVAALICACRA